MMVRTTTNDTPLVVLATGGTGGHVFPAQALAEELAGRGYRLALLTDRRGGDFGDRLPDLQTYRIQAAGVAGKSFVNRVFSTGELAVGTLQAWQILKRLRPAAVIGFGGYASMPTMAAASVLGIGTAIHEQNAVLGRANRLMAGRVQYIATCYPDTKGIPIASEARVVVTGMPVRAEIIEMRSRDYPVLDAASPIHLLVMGGSQGAAIFSQVIPAAVERLQPALRDRLRIVQQCRAEDLDHVRTSYSRIGVQADLARFFDDVPQQLAAAHLVVTRAGASSIAEVTTVGRPAILVPYPHSVDDHQSFNAHAVDAAGGGWLMPDESFTSAALAERLTALFTQPRTLENAAAASRTAGRPDAAIRLADIVVDQVNRNGGPEHEREAA